MSDSEGQMRTHSQHTTRSRQPCRRTRTRSIHTHPFRRCQITDTARPPCRRSHDTAWSTRSLQASRSTCCRSNRRLPRRRRGLFQHRHSRGSNEHSSAHLTLEIPLSLDAAIVFPSIIVKFNADPFAGLEKSVTDITDYSCTAG